MLVILKLFNHNLSPQLRRLDTQIKEEQYEMKNNNLNKSKYKNKNKNKNKNNKLMCVV
jgi:hypothetical protein